MQIQAHCFFGLDHTVQSGIPDRLPPLPCWIRLGLRQGSHLSLSGKTALKKLLQVGAPWGGAPRKLLIRPKWGLFEAWSCGETRCPVKTVTVRTLAADMCWQWSVDQCLQCLILPPSTGEGDVRNVGRVNYCRHCEVTPSHKKPRMMQHTCCHWSTYRRYTANSECAVLRCISSWLR